MNIEKTNISYTETQMDKLKKENGFTLIEVLIALTIFAVGLLAVAALQTSAIKMNSSHFSRSASSSGVNCACKGRETAKNNTATAPARNDFFISPPCDIFL